MGKYLLIIVCFYFLSSCNDNSESESLPINPPGNNTVNMFKQYDTLMKYSYELIPIVKGEINSVKNGAATGFFVKQNDKLFLISNYHVFTCINTMSKELSVSQYDSLALRYKMIGDTTFKYKIIDIRNIKKKSRLVYYDEYPDLYIYPIQMPASANIYSVENSFDSLPLKRLYPKEIVAYGYYKEDIVPQQMIFYPYTYIFEPYVEMIEATSKRSYKLYNSYLAAPSSKPGMSGAPVFLKYDTIVKGLHYTSLVFGGVIGSHTDNNAIIVKPYELFSILKNLKK